MRMTAALQVIDRLYRDNEAAQLRMAAGILDKFGYQGTAHFVRAIASRHEAGEIAPTIDQSQRTRPPAETKEQPMTKRPERNRLIRACPKTGRTIPTRAAAMCQDCKHGHPGECHYPLLCNEADCSRTRSPLALDSDAGLLLFSEAE